jgi:hypothetical protein
VLREYETPLEGSARVWAEIKRPDGGTDLVPFSREAGDAFTATYELRIPGVFTARVRARGETQRGLPFEREQTLTAVAVVGGDIWNPDDPRTNGFPWRGSSTSSPSG